MFGLSCGSTQRSFDGAGGLDSSAGSSGRGSGGKSDGGSANGSGDAGDDSGGADACASVTCNAPDQCHRGLGTCSSATGACSYESKADDSACSNADDDACTADVCKAGVCTAGAAKMCPTPTACHTVGTCDATSGACSTPNVADHKACGDSLECVGGACQCTAVSCPGGCCAAGACVACTPATLASRSADVLSLAISGAQLYFLEGAGGPLVYSLSVMGGTPALLSYPAPDDGLSTIVADGAFVYGAKFGNGTLARMSTAGGAFNVIAGSQTYEDARLLTNTTSVFNGSTLSSGYLRSIPKTGGTVVPILTSPAFNYKRFAVDDSYVYFIGAGGASISRIPVAGGDPIDVASAGTNEVIGDIVLSGTQVVFASSTRVAQVAAAGGTPVPLSSGAAYPVLADSTTAYFFRAKNGSATCANGTEIYAMPLAGGGALRRLASEPTTSCILSVVQDSTALYWLAGNALKKALK